MSEKPNKQNAKDALAKWHQDQGISIRDFAEAMGYTYNFAWQVLRGEQDVTRDLVGRMLAAFGPQAAQLISEALNGKSESAHPKA